MKKNIWRFLVRPIMIVIEFPIVFVGVIFLMIGEVFVKIQDLFSKINIKCKEYFEPPRNYIVQIHGKDTCYWKRINDNLLTKKEAENLAKKYENEGYETYIS